MSKRKLSFRDEVDESRVDRSISIRQKSLIKDKDETPFQNDAIVQFNLSPKETSNKHNSSMKNTMSFMQPTESVKKKLKIRKEFKLSVDILIHQHMSICIRKHRYEFNQEK